MSTLSYVVALLISFATGWAICFAYLTMLENRKRQRPLPGSHDYLRSLVIQRAEQILPRHPGEQDLEFLARALEAKLQQGSDSKGD